MQVIGLASRVDGDVKLYHRFESVFLWEAPPSFNFVKKLHGSSQSPLALASVTKLALECSSRLQIDPNRLGTPAVSIPRPFGRPV